MSTLRRCDYWLATDGKWYMILGDNEHSYEERDCKAYGPFDTMDDADDYLSDNFSNPGGATIDDSQTEPPPEDPVNPRPTRQRYR